MTMSGITAHFSRHVLQASKGLWHQVLVAPHGAVRPPMMSRRPGRASLSLSRRRHDHHHGWMLRRNWSSSTRTISKTNPTSSTSNPIAASTTETTTATAAEIKAANPPTSTWALWHNECSFFSQKRPFANLSIAEINGNLSSMLVLAAYSMTDILQLRLTAIAATLLVLTYQYYRQVPLWIPIRWNVVLLLLNITMVSQLVSERRRANQMAPDLEELYRAGQFHERGFSRVEFCRLHQLAETVALPQGHVLVREGQAKESLHFLLEGSVLVQKQHAGTVAQLEKFHFVGEISLLTRLIMNDNHNTADSEEKESSTSLSNNSKNNNHHSKFDSAASADVVVAQDATFLKWDFETLIPYLQQDRQVRNALQAFFNYDLTSKLLREGTIQRTSSLMARRVENKGDTTKQQNRDKMDKDKGDDEKKKENKRPTTNTSPAVEKKNNT